MSAILLSDIPIKPALTKRQASTPPVDHNWYESVISRFFYNGRSFAFRGGSGSYIPLGGDSAVRQHLANIGIQRHDMGKALCDIRETQMVSYIGEIAGLPPGLHECNGSKALVTKGPHIIEGKEGEDTFVMDMLKGLLTDPEHPEQLGVFLDWLAHARRAVLKGKRTQTPAIALVGGRGAGKSLAIEIINRSLGNRTAKAYQYFSGDNRFNADLVGTELLVIDDDAASRDPRSRVAFAQNLKSNLFSASFRVEGKGTNAVQTQPVHALAIAVNEDPEHLRVLPEIDESMEDKISLFRVQQAPIPHGSGYSYVSDMLTKGMPAFLWELDIRDISESYDHVGRLKTFWHPEITEALGGMSPERHLLELIHQCWSVTEAINNHGEWIGTASELEALLTDYTKPTAHSAKRLFSWSKACGTYLGRLARIHSSGVKSAGVGHKKINRYSISGGK
jgi:hypothetical protein